MSSFKHTDYSGSHIRGGGSSSGVLVSQFRLRLALTFAWAKLKGEKFLRFIAPPTSTSTPTHRGFSMLGAKEQPVPPRRPITDIFPIPDADDRPRRTRSDNPSSL